MRYVLKNATEADRAFAEHVHEECYRDVVTNQFGAWDSAVQKQFFDQKWQPGSYSIILSGNESVGVLSVRRNPDHLFLSEIQILPAHQGKGIGSEIVGDILDRGRQQKLPVRLQVLHRSPARRLYERLGFTRYGQSETHFLYEKSCA